jgi:lipopolysaccharide cholinephosphotransferase
MQTIVTSKGIYKFEPIPLYYGRKLINKEVSKKNLLSFKVLLDLHDVKFGIIYGTLLGAIRDEDFIEHDEDTDTYVLERDRERVLALLFELQKIGFEVARYENSLLSLIRGDDYIDIYFFKKNIFNTYVCNGYIVQSKYMNKFSTISFLGKTFNTLYNPIFFLEKIYGKDWRIPKKGCNAQTYQGFENIIKILKVCLPKRVVKKLKLFLKRL